MGSQILGQHSFRKLIRGRLEEVREHPTEIDIAAASLENALVPVICMEPVLRRSIAEVLSELSSAMERFPAMRSPHEAVAIIEEEFLEFREAVFWRNKESGETHSEQHLRARNEAIQLAAMALRYLVDCCPNPGKA